LAATTVAMVAEALGFITCASSESERLLLGNGAPKRTDAGALSISSCVGIRNGASWGRHDGRRGGAVVASGAESSARRRAEVVLEHVEGGRQEAGDEIGGGGAALEPVQLSREAGQVTLIARLRCPRGR
jgi:hypothetical protein